MTTDEKMAAPEALLEIVETVMWLPLQRNGRVARWELLSDCVRRLRHAAPQSLFVRIEKALEGRAFDLSPAGVEETLAAATVGLQVSLALQNWPAAAGAYADLRERETQMVPWMKGVVTAVERTYLPLDWGEARPGDVLLLASRKNFAEALWNHEIVGGSRSLVAAVVMTQVCAKGMDNVALRTWTERLELCRSQPTSTTMPGVYTAAERALQKSAEKQKAWTSQGLGEFDRHSDRGVELLATARRLLDEVVPVVGYV